MKRLFQSICFLTSFFYFQTISGLELVDDRRRNIVVTTPVKRIISLAPHITETAFALNMGQLIVGTSSMSYFPEAAKQIPTVNTHTGIHFESIVRLQPDIVIAWGDTITAKQIKTFEELAIPVFVSEVKSLSDIGRLALNLGQIGGQVAQARQANADFLAHLERIKPQITGAAIRVFYQAWQRPIFTLGRQHIISEAITLCGGENIFSDTNKSVLSVSKESVIKRNPDMILSTLKQSEWRDAWLEWPIKAVENKALISFKGDALERPSLEIVSGIEALCRIIQSHKNRVRD